MNFFNDTLPIFSDYYDKGELATAAVLKQNLFKDELNELIKKYKEDSLKLNNFEDEKIKMSKLFKENIKLKFQIALEKKLIHKNINTNFDFLENEINNDIDFSYIEKNNELISNRLQIMKREIKQINL
jgi:hypothetical protein